MLFSTEKWRAVRNLAPIVLVGACSLTVSVGASYMMAKSETRAAIQEFDGRADNQAAVLENGINEYWSELYAVQDLFKSLNRNVTRGEFDRFVRLLMSRHSAILNIAWAPRVKRG